MKRAHLVVSVFVLTGCAGLIGVPDLSFEEGGGGTIDGAPQSDANTTSRDANTPPGDDGGPIVPACDQTKLQTDPHHCGRCGHDCLGGACNTGKCESVLVQGGLSNPNDLAIDATNVYVTTRSNGLVLRIKKDGSQSDVLANGQTNARGVTLDGQNLFWSNRDFGSSSAGDGYRGGVWACVLPGCTNQRLVTTGDYAENVRFSNGLLYFVDNNNGAIVRVKPDGTDRTALETNATQPFSLVVDAEHVYYESASGLDRLPIGGGASLTVDPLTAPINFGFLTVDADRLYYAFSVPSSGDGFVYSASKAQPDGPKEKYGTANKGSSGVTVDSTNLYWTNAGTFDAADEYASKRDGEILACPKAGCGGAAPVSLEKDLLSPLSILVDGDAIYYLNDGSRNGSSDGELRRIAKP